MWNQAANGLEIFAMTNASRMLAITNTTSSVLTSTKHALSFDELQEKVQQQGGTSVSSFDVREAAWRLVNSQVAVFTPDRKVKTIPANVRRLNQMRS